MIARVTHPGDIAMRILARRNPNDKPPLRKSLRKAQNARSVKFKSILTQIPSLKLLNRKKFEIQFLKD